MSLKGTSFGRVAHTKIRVALLARAHVGALMRVRDEVHVRVYWVFRARAHEVTLARLQMLQMSFVFMFTYPIELQNLQREVVSRTFGCNLSEACLPELPRTGHYAKGCAARGARDRPGCQKKHHSLLHPPAEMGEIREGENSLIASQGSVNVLKGGERPSEKRVCLRVVPLRVQGCSNSRIAETYALLDDGSDLSLCDLQLLEHLG